MTEDAKTRERMQQIGRGVANQIPPGWGFAVFVFPMEGREGLFNYVANGKREDIANALKEFIAKTEQGFGTHQEDFR